MQNNKNTSNKQQQQKQQHFELVSSSVDFPLISNQSWNICSFVCVVYDGSQKAQAFILNDRKLRFVLWFKLNPLDLRSLHVAAEEFESWR